MHKPTKVMAARAPTIGKRKRKCSASGAVVPTPHSASLEFSLSSQVPVTKHAQKSASGLVHRVEINSSPARFYVTKADFQERFAVDTNVRLSTCGRYLQDNGILPLGEEPLYLLLEAETEEAMEKAKIAIELATTSVEETQTEECRLSAHAAKAKGELLGSGGQFVKHIEQKFGGCVQLMGSRVYGKKEEDRIHLTPCSKERQAVPSSCVPPLQVPPPESAQHQLPLGGSFMSPVELQEHGHAYAQRLSGYPLFEGSFVGGRRRAPLQVYETPPPLPTGPPPSCSSGAPPLPPGPPPGPPLLVGQARPLTISGQALQNSWEPRFLARPTQPRKQLCRGDDQPPAKKHRSQEDDPLLKPLEGRPSVEPTPAAYNPQASVTAALRKTYERPAERGDMLRDLTVPDRLESTSTAPLAQPSGSDHRRKKPFWAVGGGGEAVFGASKEILVAQSGSHDRTGESVAKAKEAEFDSFMMTIGVQKP